MRSYDLVMLSKINKVKTLEGKMKMYYTIDNIEVRKFILDWIYKHNPEVKELYPEEFI